MMFDEKCFENYLEGSVQPNVGTIPAFVWRD
jgi:hypothetical protein